MKIDTKTHPRAPLTESLLTEVDAATFLRMSVKTLRNWRCQEEGPEFYKVGGRLVRYRQSDLEAFITDGQPKVDA